MASTILADNGVTSGSAGIKTSADSTGVLALQSTTAGGTATTAVTIDNSQNMGLGVTPSAWKSNYKAAQVGNATSIVGRTDSNNNYFSSNWYVNSSNQDIYQNTGFATIYSQGTGTHAWYTAASGTAGNAISFTQAMTLDASGRLLLNTSSASSLNPSRLEVSSTGITDGDGGGNALLLKKAEFNAGSQTATMFRLQSGTSTQNQLAIGLFTDSGGVSGSFFDQVNGSVGLTFRTGGTERARIDSSGNLLVGTTSQLGAGLTCISYPAATKWGIALRPNDQDSGSAIVFLNATGGSVVGQISVTSSNTSYVTSSDYRLKEEVAPMTGALNKVALLKPVTYKWKTDGSDGQGFIAHELQSVIPDAVIGEKDAVNKDGSIKAQGIDTSFLVATLTAAIQELKAELDAAKARITTLEA